jgi:hypothetical protein
MKKFLLLLIIAIAGLTQTTFGQVVSTSSPFNYGTGLVASNTAPFSTVGGTNISVSGNDITVTGNVTMASGIYNFRNFTVDPTAVITLSGTAPIIIRCTGTCTINGTIRGVGGAGGNNTGNATAGAGGAAGGGGGRAGGNGGTGGTASSGGTGVLGTSFPGTTGRGTPGNNGNSNAGGNGGCGGSYFAVGGNGGGTTNTGIAYGDVNLTTLLNTTTLLGGSGGGGGGSNNGTAGQRRGGTGGGGGGGAIAIAANTITFGASGLISVKGGQSGNATGNTSGGVTPIFSGSGGGGAGGTVLLQSLQTAPAPAVNTTPATTATSGIDISGGNRGTGGFTGGLGSQGRSLIQQDNCTPSTQASSFSSSVVDPNTLSVGFTRGNGSGGVIIVARATATAAVAPTQLTSYSTTTFGAGTIGTNMTGTGNYIVYNGTGNGINTAITPVNVGGLTTGVSYSFDMYERSTGNCYNLVSLTGSNTPSACTPPSSSPTGPITYSVTTTSQITLNWTNATTGDAVLVVVRQTTPLSGGETPVISTSYTTQSTSSIAYNAGQALGAGYIAYNNTVTPSSAGSVTITGLATGTTYYIGIYSYDSGTACYNVSLLSGSQATLNPMTYTSSNTVQQTGTVAPGATNQAILQIPVVVGGGTNPALTLTQLIFNTTGSTSAATDILNAKIYYTGTTSTFSTTNLFGTVSGPNGSHTVNGSQTLAAVGTNYFWLAYDIATTSTAVVGNVVDAQCTSLTLSDGTTSNTYTPSTTAPAGSREIFVSGYCSFAGGASFGSFACGFNDYGLTSLSLNSVTLYTNASCTNAAYFDNYATTPAVSVNAGQSYTLSLTRFGGNYEIFRYIYVDWNNDGDFVDAGESMVTTKMLQGTTVYTNTAFAIPSTAAAGNHRMRVVLSYGAPTSCSGTQSSAYDFRITVLPPQPMVYVQTDVTQASTASVTYNTSDWEVLRLNIKTLGALTPLVLNELAFNTTGTTNTTDILSAKLWKTTGSTFTSATQVGSTINTPNGALAFSTLNQTLTGGDNYYWLTYRIAPCAVVGNVIDAQATGILIGSSTTTPAPNPSSPTGTRTIVTQPTLVFLQDWDTNNSSWQNSPLTITGTPHDGYNSFTISPACNYTGNGNSVTITAFGFNCAYETAGYTNISTQSLNINTTSYIPANGVLTLYYDVFQNGSDLNYDYSKFFYSIDGGTNWILIENVYTTNGFVETRTFNLPSSAFGITNFRFRAQFITDNLDGLDPPFLLDNVMLVYTPNNPTNVPNLVVTNPAPVTSPATVNITTVPTVVTDNNNTTGTYTYYSTLADAQAGINPLATPTAITTSGTYYIKKTVTATGCSDIEPVVVTINLPGPLTWDGSTSTDWNDATNWTPQNIPTALDDIIIPNTVNDPVISLGGNAACKDVDISSGATILLDAGKTLDVKGEWTGANNTVSGGGKTIFSGTAGAQTITGGATFSTLQINNSNGVTIASGGNTVNITKALELKAGVLTTNGNLKTKSTSSASTAYIDDFSSGFTGSISGIAYVERFIPTSPSGFRYIGQPVNTGTGVMAISAMEGFTVTGQPGQTIPLPTCSPTFNPINVAINSPYGNLMYYQESGPFGSPACRQRGWWFQTTGSLTVGRGYGIKQGGNTVITFKGNVNTGTVTATNASTYTNVWSQAGDNGWNLVSNPFPSAITLNNTDGISQLSDNPATSNNMPYGYTYALQFYITGNSTQTGSYVVRNVLTQPTDIALGQGFWVRVDPAISSSATWKLGQGHRITSAPTYYDVNPTIESHLNVNVLGNNMEDVSDIYFIGAADNDLDLYDGNKWESATGHPTLYTKAGSEVMGINSLPSLTETKVVPMGLKPGANGNYTFTFEDIASFPQTAMIYLEDLKLGTMNNLRDNATYEFAANLNDSPDRFMLHFQPGLQAEVADQDCDSEGTIELTQPAPTVWSTYEVKGNDNNVYATGANLTGTVTVSNLPAQEYVVTVTHPSGYSAQEYITVNGSNPISASINASSTLVMVDEMVTLTANATNASEYVWNFGDGNTQTGSGNVVHAYDAEGTYNVTLTASNSDCNSEVTKIIKVNNNATGLNGTAASNLNIYGQGERVVIEFNKWGGDKADIFMYNTLGQRMESLTGVSTLKGRQELSISDIKPGYYFIQVVSNGKVLGKKVFLGKQ